MNCIRFLALCALCVACAEQPSAPRSGSPTRHANLDLTSAVITTIDLSNGSGLEGDAMVLSSDGLILGRLNGRGWWQSPGPAFNRIDGGSVTRGNRNADAGGGQNTVLLSTNGGAPWTVVTLQIPAGAPSVYVRDLNDARVVVGQTLGSDIYAVRWENPYAAPTPLPLPPLPYPAQSWTAHGVNNLGVIVGYVNEKTGKNSTRNDALVWSGGSVSVLPWAPGAISQLASNVNDAGVISGYMDAGRTSYPVRWTPRADAGYDVTVLNLASSYHNLYTGIDGCGRITGGSDQGAFVWDGVSAPRILPRVGGSTAWGAAFDINDNGQVVGTSAAGTARGSVIARPTLWTGLPPCAG